MQTFHLTDWRNIPTPDLSRGERGLLKTLIMLSFNKERLAHPSQQFLADEQGCSVRQIKKDLRKLIVLKYIIAVGKLANRAVQYLINWARLVPKNEAKSYPQERVEGEPQFPNQGKPYGNHSSPYKGTTVPLEGEPQFLQDKVVKYEIKEKHVLELSKTQTLTPEQVEHLRRVASGDNRYATRGESQLDWDKRVQEARHTLKQLENRR